MAVQITIHSADWVYAPGLVRLAKAQYREGNKDSAHMMIGSCPNITPDQIEAIVAGAVEGRVDTDAETITFEFPNTCEYCGGETHPHEAACIQCGKLKPSVDPDS
ncbi:hypothetical protein [Marinomonas sp.]|uniref:hypothetical protein n=1 Tax=Marinomonas sp. TaxID=1904862 RepID=UPI003A923624